MTNNVALVSTGSPIPAFGTEAATAAAGGYVLSSVLITPPANAAYMKFGLDITGETSATGPYIALYVAEQNQANTAIYGDGTPSGTTPPSEYPIATLQVRPSVAAGGVIARNTDYLECPLVPFYPGLLNETGYVFTAATINVEFFYLNTNQ
jgi:hypothetical protein